MILDFVPADIFDDGLKRWRLPCLSHGNMWARWVGSAGRAQQQNWDG